MPAPRITLLTRPGCHLCDDARAALEGVLAEPGLGLGYDETSIADDADLLDRYGEEIPVVLLDDRVHSIWRLDPDRLRASLREALA